MWKHDYQTVLCIILKEVILQYKNEYQVENLLTDRNLCRV